MPDYFVPLDTTEGSAYLNRLYFARAMQEFAFQYFSDHQKELEKRGFDDFKENFRVSPSMEEMLMSIGDQYKVKRNLPDLAKNRDLFHLHMKAQIARRIWGDDGLFEFLNETNEILNSAIKLMDKSEELDRSKF